MKTRKKDTPSSIEVQNESTVLMNETPPKLLVLPESRCSDARILTLAHPRTSTPCKYYFDPVKGIFEFTKVAAPKKTPCSWLVAKRAHSGEDGVNPTSAKGDSKDKPDDAGSLVVEARPVSDGYAIKDTELLVATPIDPLFLLLPSLAQVSGTGAQPSKALFLSADDHFDKYAEISPHFSEWLTHEPIRQRVEERMAMVCDNVDAGDEKMYRLNVDKLLEELVRKAKCMVEQGLPASIEGRFIRTALETPIMTIKREESSVSDTDGPQMDTSASVSTPSDTLVSQARTDTSTLADSITTDITIPDSASTVNDIIEIQHLLRLRTALSYMISSYIAAPFGARLITLLASPESPINFSSLDSHLEQLAKLRAEALAARSLGEFSHKRNMFEDDDAAETRAEKKRKKEEEEKQKKAGETRGIRDLKKVDTTGMKKMSDFFGKAVKKK